MSGSELPESVKQRIYAEQHRLLEDPIGLAVRRILDANVGDAFADRALRERVARHRIARAFAGAIELPPGGSNGALFLGCDQRGRPVRVPVDLLLTHELTLGSTGSGKTTRTLSLIAQAGHRTQGLWLFDVTKRDLRKARGLLAAVGVDLLIMPAKQLALNPLAVPQGVAPAEWATRVAELLVQVLGVPPRATKLLHAQIFHLFETRGVLRGGDDYPTLRQLRDVIEADRKANPQARAALLDSLAGVLAAMPNIADCSRGWPIEELARHAILFDLTGLPRAMQDLLMTNLLLGVFTQRVAAGRSNVPLDLLICIDEAQRLLNTAGASQNALADLWPLVRGSGIALQLGIPTAHNLMPEALSFTGNKWLGRCGSAADYQAFGAAMGLSREQIVWASQNLKAGSFIVQLGETDWRRPFLITVQPPRVPLTVDTTEVHLGPLAALPVVMVTTPSPQTLAVTPRLVHGPLGDDRARRLCRAVVDQPLQPSSVYPKLAGISARTAVDVRRELVAAGLLRERQVQPAGRGRPAVLLEPTPAAVAALADIDAPEVAV